MKDTPAAGKNDSHSWCIGLGLYIMISLVKDVVQHLRVDSQGPTPLYCYLTNSINPS